MKISDIKVTVKLINVLHAPLFNAWEHMCEKYEINEWCLNEGLADDDSTVEISLEDAKLYGLIEHENNDIEEK